MKIDTNTMVSITEADIEADTEAKDEDIFDISKRLIEQNREAYEVLAE